MRVGGVESAGGRGMLLSLREFTVWTGAGPFEASLHCLGLLLSTVLTVLRVEGRISTSWHVVMTPLYVALGTTVYLHVILYLRMALSVWKRSKRRLWVAMTMLGLPGPGVLLFAEYSLADFLDHGGSSSDSSMLVTSVSLLLGYLFVRAGFAYRALKVD